MTPCLDGAGPAIYTHGVMEKIATASFLAVTLILAPVFAGAQVKEEEYEIRSACKATSRLFTPAGAPAELEITVDDGSSPQHGFGSFKKLVRTEGGVLMPLMGFNLCDSYKHGPVAVAVQIAGDFQKISMTCGGTWQPVAGESSLTIQTSTQKVVQARVRLEGAYGNGTWHSGIVKNTLESFACENADYMRSIAPLFDAPSVQTVRGSIARGAFTKTP